MPDFLKFMELLLTKGEAEAMSFLEKSSTTASSLSIGGALTPSASHRYFTTVTDESSFLNKVENVQVGAIEQDVDLFHVSDRQLQRVPEGSEPGSKTGATNKGKRWHLKDVQLFPDVNFSTLIDRQRQGNIETYLSDLFAKVFRNDLLQLGLVGNEADADAFVKLNDGWFTLAKNSTDTAKEANVLATGVDHLSTLDAMLQAMPDKYLKEGQTSFLMSKKNALAWGKEMASKDGLNPYFITGNIPSYNGYSVEGVAGFPQDKFLLTDPKNLGFGMGSTIQRYREVNGRKRCIEYTWTLYSDYIIFNDEAVVLSE
jgi:hypothetical protein